MNEIEKKTEIFKTVKSWQKEKPIQLKSILHRIIVVKLLTNLSRKK